MRVSEMVYATGLTHCSVCTDATDDELDAMVQRVNIINPTGILSQWQIADEPFASGEPNPTPCNHERDGRRHFLMVC